MRAYRVAYDGRPYHGFQRQPDVSTVEDTLLAALRTLDAFEGDDGTPEGWAAAGRTDAGVSATHQTVAFEAPGWLTPAAFDAELPAEVRVWASATVSAFHATHDAREREYTYLLRAPTAAVPAGFDERAREAATRLAGEHDFHNLTPDETGTVRDLSVTLARDGDFLVCRLRAGGFARQLVRRVVRVVDTVARGERALGAVDRLLAPAPVDGPEGVAPAPAYPLVLTGVDYGLAFERDDEALASLRDVFEGRRGEYETRARVAGLLADP
jgi:tRNA pseudouridine38-40 synthase